MAWTSVTAEHQTFAVFRRDTQVDAERVPGGMSSKLPGTEAPYLGVRNSATGVRIQSDGLSCRDDQDAPRHASWTAWPRTGQADHGVHRLPGCDAHAANRSGASGHSHHALKDLGVSYGEHTESGKRLAERRLEVSACTP